MFQDQLPLDQGMLFVFPEQGLYSLWMLNMQFELDMIWFDNAGNVVHIKTNVPPCVIPVEIAADVQVLYLMVRQHIFLKLHLDLLNKIILQKILF